jgi:hyperosmotically inducible protein
MNLKQKLIAVTIFTGTVFCLGLCACNTQAKKDAVAKAAAKSAVPGISIEVKDGIATIDGAMNSSDAVTTAEETIKHIENVKTIVSHLTVNDTPVPSSRPINPDQALIDGVHPILREYPGVTASIKDDVIDLTGKISKADWMELNRQLEALKPRQILNNMKIK